jgi:hypothetical protein
VNTLRISGIGMETLAFLFSKTLASTRPLSSSPLGLGWLMSGKRKVSPSSKVSLKCHFIKPSYTRTTDQKHRKWCQNLNFWKVGKNKIIRLEASGVDFQWNKHWFKTQEGKAQNMFFISFFKKYFSFHNWLLLVDLWSFLSS